MAASASCSSSAKTEVEIVSPHSEFVCAPSTSAPPNHYHYQVFINHRGPDVKKTLASHIYHVLHDRGIRVFLDQNEMQRGEFITPQIEAAIRSASVHIAIFSQGYADSRCCLDELCVMMEHPQKMLPVFYNVEPSDLRRLDKDGPYATAMRVHQNKGRYDSQTIEKWKQSLTTVADISGYELKQFNGDEGELLKNIVDNVSKRVKREPWDAAQYPVGLSELARDFQQKMLGENRNYDENVDVVGIVGMGGCGKTTLATHIFNIKQSIYNKSCFLPDVRSHKSLTDLQSILLMHLTGVDERIYCVSHGIGILKSRPSSCQALVILDDVDHVEQLEGLLVVRGALGPGSLIVVTSGDKGLLQRSRISLGSTTFQSSATISR